MREWLPWDSVVFSLYGQGKWAALCSSTLLRAGWFLKAYLRVGHTNLKSFSALSQITPNFHVIAYSFPAKKTLIGLYKRCQDNFPPYVLSDRLEHMLTSDPSDVMVKYELAVMLRCYCGSYLKTLYPKKDYVSAIRR
jgi:hypothetical protein